MRREETHQEQDQDKDAITMLHSLTSTCHQQSSFTPGSFHSELQNLGPAYFRFWPKLRSGFFPGFFKKKAVSRVPRIHSCATTTATCVFVQRWSMWTFSKVCYLAKLFLYFHISYTFKNQRSLWRWRKSTKNVCFSWPPRKCSSFSQVMLLMGSKCGAVPTWYVKTKRINNKMKSR